MSDLQVIRRFWPWMTPPHVDYLGYKDYQCCRRGVHYLAHRHQAQWWVSVVNQHSRPWSEVFVDDDGYRIGGGPTIAAAMAAAGFAVRKVGRYAAYGRINAKTARRWQQGMLPDYCRCELVSRQRPRKGVRFGKRQRKEVPC